MIRLHNPDARFELGGINHVALMCADTPADIPVDTPKTSADRTPRHSVAH